MQDVAEDERPFLLFGVGAAGHEVKRDVEGVDVGVVGVVDDGASVDSVLDFESHGHRFQFLHPFRYDIGLHTDAEASGETGDGVFDGGVVDERNGVLSQFVLVFKFHGRLVSFFHHFPDDDVCVVDSSSRCGVPCHSSDILREC